MSQNFTNLDGITTGRYKIYFYGTPPMLLDLDSKTLTRYRNPQSKRKRKYAATLMRFDEIEGPRSGGCIGIKGKGLRWARNDVRGIELLPPRDPEESCDVCGRGTFLTY